MRITPKQYAQTLFELTDGKSKVEIEKSVANFARYIQKERKLKLADKIADQFVAIWNKRNGIVEATVVSRKILDEGEMKKIKHFVAEKHGAKKVVLQNVADEDIKGGIVLKVGDEVVDGSVAGRLNNLKKVLE